MADENTIYFVDYDMVQAEISMQRWADKFDAKNYRSYKHLMNIMVVE